ncbi:META domain-containing protein [Roseomonas sp. CAU 1739]|uniref:META domain-containing protein n=1 Tax=Roseomonas sp. CAU 1739 TaxID=3140364 RepID=UPI00325A77B6
MDITRCLALLAGLAIAAPAAQAQDAAGPTGAWVVEAIGATVLSGARRPDITFTDEHTAHGSSGCNRFMGGFTLEGATLQFDPVAGTRMACEPPLMEREQRFHAALEAVRGWRMDGAALLLTDTSGGTVLRLRRER